MDTKHKTIGLFLLVILFGYWSFKILSPFLNFFLLGLIIAFLFYPLYKKLAKESTQTIGAALVLIIIFLIVVIPSIWLTTTLIVQATNAYQGLQAQGIELTTTSLANKINSMVAIDIGGMLTNLFAHIRDASALSIPSFLSRAGEFFIGIVIFFFVVYYALKEGKDWYAKGMQSIPLRKENKQQLGQEIEQATKALFYGQALTAILIGILCGLLFWLFGIPNAVFWGFIMMIFGFLPLLGAPMIYVPAGIILIMRSHWIAGLSLIALCSVVIFLVDYVIRPKFVSNQAAIHPLTVIVGALGGIYLLGFLGFLIGPLILKIFLTLISFEYE
jgi:predicted PurR-regulated permease PerM